MPITFAVRGTSLDARYSRAGKTPGRWATVGANLPVLESTNAPGVIGGSVVNMAQASLAARSLLYNGLENLPAGRPFSILIRLAFSDVSSLQGIFQIGGPWGGGFTPGQIYLFFISGNSWRVAVFGDDSSAIVNNFAIGTFTPSLSTFHDIVMTCTGDTTANGLKLFIDGTLVGQTTMGANLPVTRDRNVQKSISLGTVASDVSGVRWRLNEFVIWDEVITPSSVALTSGTGSLNGASRSAFVEAAAFDGLAYTDPGQANVLSGVQYTFAGNARTGSYVCPAPNFPANADVRLGVSFDNGGRTGTLDLPAQADVKIGTAFDNATKTGTYTGAERFTDVPTSNVVAGYDYRYDSLTNNRTGTREVVTNTIQAAELEASEPQLILESEQ